MQLTMNSNTIADVSSLVLNAAGMTPIPLGTKIGAFGTLGSNPVSLPVLSLPASGTLQVSRYVEISPVDPGTFRRGVFQARDFIQYNVDEAVKAAERQHATLTLRESAEVFYERGKAHFNGGEYREAFLANLHSAAVFLRCGAMSDLINSRNAFNRAAKAMKKVGLDIPKAAILASSAAETMERFLDLANDRGLEELPPDSRTEIADLVLSSQLQYSGDEPFWKDVAGIERQVKADRQKAAWLWQHYIKNRGAELSGEEFEYATYHSIYNAYLSGNWTQLAFSFSRSAKTYAFLGEQTKSGVFYLMGAWALAHEARIKDEHVTYAPRWFGAFKRRLENGDIDESVAERFTPEIRGLLDKLIGSSEFYTAIAEAPLSAAGEVAIRLPAKDSDEVLTLRKLNPEKIYASLGRWLWSCREYSKWWLGLDYKDQGRILVSVATLIARDWSRDSYRVDDKAGLAVISSSIVSAAVSQVAGESDTFPPKYADEGA